MFIRYVTETYPPEINGVALTVERSVRFLRAAGHRVQLVRPRQRGEPAYDDEHEWLTAGCPIPLYPDLRLGLASTAQLARRWRAQPCDLVHVATPGPLGWAAVHAAARLGLPCSSDFRTNFHAYSRYYGFGACEALVCGYLRRLHNASMRCFVPTPALARELADRGFERLEVIGRGVDGALFAPERRRHALRAAWGAGAATPVLLYVGRLAAEKNVGLALEAHAALLRTLAARAAAGGPPLRPPRLVIVGDGPQRAALERRYPAALFAGVQRGEALAEHYASADVFVFPSESETFGNVTLEALASGLAVVAFASAAAALHVRDGRSGRLLAPGDAAGFRAAVTELAVPALADPQHALRRAARSAALQAEWRAVLARFEQHLQAVVEAARQRSAPPLPLPSSV